ncbi:ParA family protein [Cohnella suwonensis]|uniref:ParA family protein n=1 Tax=Cohnella suwonensis TaxID=696072 RepID=A0ABW0LUZ3_9BACL
MSIYAFWNNKGGTGKTSLAFQALCRKAELNPTHRILVIDLCPQANLSELLLGGLVGRGGHHLIGLHNHSPRKSVGGYFEQRLPTPFTVPNINVADFISTPHDYNTNIPSNIDLLAGDPIVELQANAIATLSNTQIPQTKTWLAVIDWIRDFITATNNVYDDVFIDSNPSFSIYTQIALSSADKLVLPVMADDSSRRAILNMFSLVHGINVPSADYQSYSFPSKLRDEGRSLPLIHLIVKNRLTQYVVAASAYSAVLRSIDEDVEDILTRHPEVFTFTTLSSGTAEVRDFQTTGVVALAKGLPFSGLSSGRHRIMGRVTKVKDDYLINCRQAIDDLVAKL